MVKLSNYTLNIVSVKKYCLETGMFLSDGWMLLPNDKDGSQPRSTAFPSGREHKTILLVYNRDDQRQSIPYIDGYDSEKWEKYR